MREGAPGALSSTVAFPPGVFPNGTRLVPSDDGTKVIVTPETDAFERAFVRWKRVSRLDDPVGWVRHVAVNRMRDHFRKHERGRRAMDRLGPQTATTTPAESTAAVVTSVRT